MSEPVTSVVIAKWVALLIWSIFGGIIHALTEHRKRAMKNFVDGLILAIISGFAGSMWGLIALHFYPNDIVIISFASGLGGFASLEGLAFMVTFLRDRFLTIKQ